MYQCINWLPSFYIFSLPNYAYVNVVTPSYCDTTLDLYMQGYEIMKSSRIAGFCTNFCKIFGGEDPQTPLKIQMSG